MKLLKEVKTTSLEIIDDFKSFIYRAEILLDDSPSRNIKIFFLTVIYALLIALFFSQNKVEFYINIFRVLLISFVTFFIYCLSDYFWFLIKKEQIYRQNLKDTKSINKIIKIMHNRINEQSNTGFEEKIISVIEYYSSEYKIHAKRYAIEISIFLLILLFTFPWFFLFNIAVFCAMYFYIFFHETQSIDQAFDDIGYLLYCINNFNKENPEKCEKFIAQSEQEEIRGLVWLYIAVLRNK